MVESSQICSRELNENDDETRVVEERRDLESIVQFFWAYVSTTNIF